jgi:hypothetical protein
MQIMIRKMQVGNRVRFPVFPANIGWPTWFKGRSKRSSGAYENARMRADRSTIAL